LRDVVVPRISDKLASQRSKGFARVIKYLANLHNYGAACEQDELDELAALLGERPASVAAGRAAAAEAVRQGAIGDVGYLSVLGHRAARETELARPALGALADRHWPEVS
jgi:hypothetical protein